MSPDRCPLTGVKNTKSKKFFRQKISKSKKFFFVKNFLSPKMSPDRCKKIFLRKKKNLGKKNFFEKKIFLKKKNFSKKIFSRARARGARARSWGHPGSNDTPQVGIWGQKISFSRLARGRARVPGSRRFQRYMTCGPRCPGTQRILRDHSSM